ncbi:uncharacterized protein [Dermacentor andersoni]|uniref:uncharacterized protein isoform X1 n=1 Tax=Dermacentor andersoni TaxID=34620 RepID=UPI0021554BD3|nr:uncharacterized protein LOC126517410 isoform X1 [Dermacentor andersoni]
MSALGQLGVTQLLVVTDPRARRKANFSRAEIDALVSGYKTYRPLIERRCTGGSKDRNQAWDLITKSLFAVSGVRRTAAEVRKKWADLKSLSKKGANCGVTAGNLLAEASLFNNLNEFVIGMPIEDCLLGSSTEAPSSTGTEEPSDNLNSNADVKAEPPSSPGEVSCDNKSNDPEPEHEDEVPCNSRSTQTTEPSSPSERQLFEVSGSPDMKKMRVGGRDEETSELLETQKEILHVLKRLAKAQERLVQLKAWKHGVKLTEDGISYEHQTAEHSRKNGLQGATPASIS